MIRRGPTWGSRVRAADWLALLATAPPGVAWALLFGGAFLEYVFPPFPGDTVVVAGAALTGALGWHPAPAFVAVTVGAVAGSAVATAAGRWAAPRLDRLGPAQRAAVDRLVSGFETHGAAYLALNRFVPGVRGLFFVAAGVVGLRWSAVLLWSTVSAVAWNTLLFAVGWGLGSQVDRLDALVRSYAVVVGGVVALAVVIALWRAWQAARQHPG